MEEIRSIEELEDLLRPMVDDGRTAAAVELVNGLNREQSNALAVRLVEMLVALPKNDDEARLAIRTLFADQPFRIAAQLVLAQHTHHRNDIFALQVMIAGLSGEFVLDPDVKRAAKALVATLDEAPEPPPNEDEEPEATEDGPAEAGQ